MKKDKVRKNFFNDLCVLLSLFKKIVAKDLRLTSKIQTSKVFHFKSKVLCHYTSQLDIFAQCVQQCYE